jgi:hypothetical protein
MLKDADLNPITPRQMAYGLTYHHLSVLVDHWCDKWAFTIGNGEKLGDFTCTDEEFRAVGEHVRGLVMALMTELEKSSFSMQGIQLDAFGGKFVH